MTPAPVKIKKRLRLRASNRFKVLLCYLICFSLPLLWQWAGLWLVYPYKLAFSAPTIADTLAQLLPAPPAALLEAASAAADPLAGGHQVWSQALQIRDLHWQRFVLVCFGIAFLATLVLQLLWRILHGRAINAAKQARRAKRNYRLTQLGIWLLNAAVAYGLWYLGVSKITGRTLWDLLVYFPPYVLNALAALLCFRLAAPPVISGKHGFFKRL
ncbi:MAG: hypothetical protein E7319_05495 [Clostridiales bacterium]|nr:hypothetical protein [Clostridiales bacterium]